MSVQVLPPFVGKDHNHTITGILKIIDSDKLGERFPKGPKYRKNKTVDYQKAEEKNHY